MLRDNFFCGHGTKQLPLKWVERNLPEGLAKVKDPEGYAFSTSQNVQQGQGLEHGIPRSNAL